jgi:uncharacterized coiled-coil DUF342 family protein
VAEVDKVAAEVNKVVAEVDEVVAEVDEVVAEVNKVVAKEDTAVAEVDKVVAEIKRNYPSWSEEQVYHEVDRLADIYENERFNHIIKVTVIECQNMVKELQKIAEA